MIVRMSKYHTVALPIMALVLSSIAPVTRASGSGEFGRVLGKAEYKVSPESREQFLRNGWTTLDDVLTEDELVKIEEIYDRFMLPPGHPERILCEGKDFCDMSKPFETPFEEYSIINAMLPTRYHPPFQDNIYERIAKHICDQIYPPMACEGTMDGVSDELVKDYDQLLNKRPGKKDAVFGWHQDSTYQKCDLLLFVY